MWQVQQGQVFDMYTIMLYVYTKKRTKVHIGGNQDYSQLHNFN